MCGCALPRPRRRWFAAYAETRYGAKSRHYPQRVAARIEATTKGLDIRYDHVCSELAMKEAYRPTELCAQT
jgi:hypothetical protein